MSSNLGFGGGGGVGRPFTFQDLFAAVSSDSLSSSVSTNATILNLYCPTSDDVGITETMTLAITAPAGYDTATWESSIWG